MNGWIPEVLFAEFMRHMPICTVDVALFNADVSEVLLLRRTNPPLNGEWFTLGGRLLKGETVKNCAVRQAHTETGLQLDPGRLFFGSVFDEIFDDSRFGPEIPAHCVNICFGYVLTEPPEIRLDDQHDQYAWKSVYDLTLHPALKRKIGVLLSLARQAKRQEA